VAELQNVQWMLQVCLVLSQFQGGVDTPALKLVIDNVGTQLTLRSFDMCIDAFLGAICLQHLKFSRKLRWLFCVKLLFSFGCNFVVVKT